MSAQAGLLPNEVLDLNLGQVQAVINGYSERVLDEVCVAVWSGYYSGYYTNAKHAKKPSSIIQSITDMSSTVTPSGQPEEVNWDDEIERFARLDLQRLSATKEG